MPIVAFALPFLDLHDGALVASSWLVWVLGLLDLSNHQLKCLGDILVVTSARLSPRTLVLLSELLAILWSDLTLFWTQVALVTNNHDWNPVGAL